MDNKMTFISLLKPLKRQLHIEITVKELQVFLMLSCLFYFFWMMISRVFVIAFVTRYLLLGIGILLLLCLFRLWKQSPTTRDAAIIMNHYVADDRVLSAYSFIEDKGAVEQLLISDANRHMKKQLPTVLKRKRQWFYPKLILIGSVFLAFGLLSYFFPNATMEAGVDKEKELRLIDDITKDMEKKINNTDGRHEKQILQEHLEEMKKAKSAKEFMEQLAKAHKELELEKAKETIKQQDLVKWQKALESAGIEELAHAIESLDKDTVSSEIDNLIEGLSNLSKEEQAVLSELSDVEMINKEALEEWKKRMEESLLANERKETLQTAQSMLETQAERLEDYLETNQLPIPDVAIHPSSNNQNQNESSGMEQGQNGSNQGSNGNGENTGENGNSSGQNGSSQSGNSGNGSSQGEPNQSGTGSNSNGQGSSGAGYGQGTREFLTIPETLDGKIYMEEDFGRLGEGKQGSQYETDGPVVKGNLRSYEEVFREYEDVYRESLQRMNLPQDLETIIKTYFTNVKP